MNRDTNGSNMVIHYEDIDRDKEMQLRQEISNREDLLQTNVKKLEKKTKTILEPSTRKVFICICIVMTLLSVLDYIDTYPEWSLRKSLRNFFGLYSLCLIFFILLLLMDIYAHSCNKKLSARIEEEYRKYDNDTRKARQELDEIDLRRRAARDELHFRQEAARLEEINIYRKRILDNPEDIEPMVNQNVKMFQRMISHVDAGSNIPIIKADFTYEVNYKGITYSYQSQYSNPQDDFNFNENRFHDLNRATECEGLAQALAVLTVKRMKTLYSPNSTQITFNCGQNPGEIKMHFKAANSNFIPAKDIF